VKGSILIVAEGDHELSGGHPDGALLVLVRRLLGDGVELEATGKKIRELSAHMHPGRGDRLGRKFIGIIRLAERGRLRDLYSLVAAEADLQILRDRCPTGFAVFAERVEAMKSVFPSGAERGN
jgi:hypothetical protein